MAIVYSLTDTDDKHHDGNIISQSGSELLLKLNIVISECCMHKIKQYFFISLLIFPSSLNPLLTDIDLIDFRKAYGILLIKEHSNL
jgi:hypothetical protein